MSKKKESASRRRLPANQLPLVGIECVREELERALDDIATEQAIMGKPQNQRQNTYDDRSAIKDQAMIQVLR